MKKILLIVILILSFQTLANADNIKDFEIEGITIGDSLLDYYREDEIKKNFFYKSKKYFSFSSTKYSSKNYDGLQFHIKGSDNTYKIVATEGIKLFVDKFNECKDLKQIIVNQLSSMFINAEKRQQDGNHTFDTTGNSKFYSTLFYLNPNNKFSSIKVTCFNWSEKLEKRFGDKLSVSIHTQPFQTFMAEEAY